MDLPLADRPVSQIVRPRWLRKEQRSDWVTPLAWKVMFLFLVRDWIDWVYFVELRERVRTWPFWRLSM